MSFFDSKRMAPVQQNETLPQDDFDDTRCVDEAVRLGMIDGIILNVGCGTGELALALAERCSGVTVLGVDESSRLIGLATEEAERTGLAHRVHFQAATLRSTRFKAAYFDGLISSGALRQAADPVALLNEMARVVKPEGAVLIRDLRRPLSPRGGTFDGLEKDTLGANATISIRLFVPLIPIPNGAACSRNPISEVPAEFLSAALRTWASSALRKPPSSRTLPHDESSEILSPKAKHGERICKQTSGDSRSSFF